MGGITLLAQRLRRSSLHTDGGAPPRGLLEDSIMFL